MSFNGDLRGFSVYTNGDLRGFCVYLNGDLRYTDYINSGFYEQQDF